MRDHVDVRRTLIFLLDALLGAMMMHRQCMTLTNDPTDGLRGDVRVKALVRLQIMDRPHDTYTARTHQHEQQYPRRRPHPTDESVGMLDDGIEKVQM